MIKGISNYPDWQPIETAPRDNTIVLLCWPDEGVASDFPPETAQMMIGTGYYETGAYQSYVGWMCDNQENLSPTHWMPLPEMPK